MDRGVPFSDGHPSRYSGTEAWQVRRPFIGRCGDLPYEKLHGDRPTKNLMVAASGTIEW